MIRAIFLAFAVFWAALSPAHAVRPDEVLADPTLEARAREISAELRCMVCQNQSIDDSDAPLARDLRLLVRERVQAGDTDYAIRTFLSARYGDFILLKPPLKFETILLWVGPGLVLLLGAAVIAWRRSRKTDLGAPGIDLTSEERAALKSLLATGQASDATRH
ncbi:MAG: cytochrome c-type biosis protein CcmH [Methylobacteriaceae bacterium]|jgi:cytochrome c-type biogenesis protein CcmH|nr:cytochrome c-type biosis protein CcmH [Methylobacteriaceae bacterium]